MISPPEEPHPVTAEVSAVSVNMNTDPGVGGEGAMTPVIGTVTTVEQVLAAIAVVPTVVRMLAIRVTLRTPAVDMMEVPSGFTAPKTEVEDTGNWADAATPLISVKAGWAAVNNPVELVKPVRKLLATGDFVTANCVVLAR
jgi:hypothetical protein